MLRQKLARGEPLRSSVDVGDTNLTFAEFAPTWLADYVLPNNKFSEQQAKRYILTASLVPFFGKLAIKDITSHHLEQYKGGLVKQGYSSKTIRNRLTVLNKCLICAYEWLTLKGSPPKTNWPKSPLPKTDYLSPAESEQLLANADGIIRDMILMTLRTGMRLGEIKGLQWSSIDWSSHTIRVCHSLCSIRKMLDTPKHDRVRYIPLDPEVAELLIRRRRIAGYVFTDEEQKPFTTYRLNYQLARICKRAGLRVITWHSLRHSFASHLAMRGTPLNVVQTLLGHSSITTTMRYAHVAPSTMRAAIDMLSAGTFKSSNFGQPVGNQWFEQQRKVASGINGGGESSLELSH